MSANRTRMAGMIPLSVEKITLSNSTASGVNSTNAVAKAILFSVETNNVRFRDDGTDAALTTGVLYTTGNSPYLRDGISNAGNISFQRSTGTATINLIGYRFPGDQAS